MLESEEFKVTVKNFIEDASTNSRTFVKFWKWKINLESKEIDIFRGEYLEKTEEKLLEMVKLWRLYRPKSVKDIKEKLHSNLRDLSNNYNKVKQLKVTDTEDLNNHRNDLLNVWECFAKVKEDGTSDSKEFLVMSPTKFLMFVWGQTPAFDSYLRSKEIIEKADCRLGFKYKPDERWSFEDWFDTLVSIGNSLNNNEQIRNAIEALNGELFSGSNGNVPYGFFLDAYLWESKNETK